MSKSVPVPDLAAVMAFQQSHGPRCNVALTLTDLDAKARATFEAALEAPRLTSASISRWLDSIGAHVSQTSIQRHRRQECTCGRS